LGAAKSSKDLSSIFKQF